MDAVATCGDYDDVHRICYPNFETQWHRGLVVPQRNNRENKYTTLAYNHPEY